MAIVAKSGRYGPYVTEVLPEDAPKNAKPRTGSLFKDMSLDTVTLEDALRLLSLPRVVGVDADGVEITAQNGRYGPYLKKGTDSRSLEREDQLLLDHARGGARDLCAAQGPRARSRGAAAARARRRPRDRASRIVVKDGRFGAYVTDGETNATLRKADTVEGVTVERAAELLAEKRAAGPAKKGGRRPAKKTAAKKTTKKTTAKKTRSEGTEQLLTHRPEGPTQLLLRAQSSESPSVSDTTGIPWEQRILTSVSWSPDRKAISSSSGPRSLTSTRQPSLGCADLEGDGGARTGGRDGSPRDPEGSVDGLGPCRSDSVWA